MKKILGIILSVLLICSFFGFFIYQMGIKLVLLATLAAAIIIGLIWLCFYLLSDD